MRPNSGRLIRFGALVSLLLVCAGTAYATRSPQVGANAELAVTRATGHILVMECVYDPAGTTLTGVNLVRFSPRPGATGTVVARFSIPLNNRAGYFDFGLVMECGSDAFDHAYGGGKFVGSSLLRRQLFNRDYTHMAIGFSGRDSSSRVGYISTTGTMHDLTGRRSGYEAPRDDENPLLQPGTNNLVFSSKVGGNYVNMTLNTVVGKGSRKRAVDRRIRRDHQAADSGARTSIVFSPDGKRQTSLIYETEDSYGPSFPDENTEAAGPFLLDSSDSIAVTNIDTGHAFSGSSCSESADVIVQPASRLYGAGSCLRGIACQANAWVDSHRFLCDDGASVYVVSVGGDYRSARETPLLPAIGRTVWSPVPSPPRTSFAFFSRGNGAGDELWTAPIVGTGAPRRIAAMPPGVDPVIISWKF